jgi:hypothetical protein
MKINKMEYNSLKQELQNLIEKGKILIEESEYNLLPLYFRNEILRNIGDPKIIGRLSIICALKVLPLWKKHFSDIDEIMNLLAEAENYKEENKENYLKNVDHMYTFVEDKNDEENFAALYAGFAAVKAAYEASEKHIEEKSIDDFELDSYEWDAAFFAFLSFSGGAVSFDKINRNKAKLFWTWYLEEAINKAYTKDILVTINQKKEENQEEINRTKYNQLNNKEIEKIINEITGVIKRPYGVELKVCCIANKSIYEVFSLETKEKISLDYPYEVFHKIMQDVSELRKIIYNLNKDEGTFYIFNLKLQKDGTKEIKYIFDSLDDYLKRNFVYKEDIIEDFKEYPRQDNYIPKWLKKIIKYDTGGSCVLE